MRPPRRRSPGWPTAGDEWSSSRRALERLAAMHHASDGDETVAVDPGRSRAVAGQPVRTERTSVTSIGTGSEVVVTVWLSVVVPSVAVTVHEVVTTSGWLPRVR